MEHRRYQPSEDEQLSNRLESSETFSNFKVPEEVRAAELTLLAAKKQPEAKLAHSTEAAKRNEPLERLYELRHEVKDQAAPQSAVAVGDVVAGVSTRQPGLAGLSPLSATDAQDSDISMAEPFVSSRSSRSLYRRAIGRGFIAALVILLCIEIYLLIRH